MHTLSHRVPLTNITSYANMKCMRSEHPMTHHAKKSKLDQFKLDFEFNRTLADERKIIKRRTDHLQ